ncbi:MAG: YcxB family protein [Firmicutes bacterium]|nr:YcxB family protein [Bacillota bacterium]
MEFRFETTYDKRALTAMAKAARKTLGNTRRKVSQVLSWIIVVVALVLAFLPLFYGAPFSMVTVVTLAVAVILAVMQLSVDALNGAVAKNKLPKGSEETSAVFNELKILSKTELGVSKFEYENIMLMVETKGYFILILSETHAEIYDKRTLTGGTVDEFRTFVETKANQKFKKA